jgi:hypothetical protein
MRLVFRGHHGSPRVSHLGQLPARPSFGDSNGSFNHNGVYSEDGNVLTVTFSPQIQIVNGLDSATEARVRAHEEEHRRDFVQQAERLRMALQRAVQQGRDHQIDLRWDWFNYDLQQAANRYHQRVGQGDIRVSIQPGRPRPV